ncbi:hypothetical protein ACSV5M_00005 [Cellvibrio sp. ARAG 10.3]|uniref:hypothetical protein n=1 Tax=Cellvibrio sp. ARAG 10.3 TaxID=3451358 RepID=UPI003F4679D7
MKFEILESEVLKLSRRHRINRWINLISAILVLVFSFYLIGVNYSEIEPGVLKSLADRKVYIFLAPFAGSWVGTILMRWNGSKELILLNKFVETGHELRVLSAYTLDFPDFTRHLKAS